MPSSEILRRPSPPGAELVETTIRVGERDLSILRPANAEALLDEDAFAEDEFLPYWAELWPAGLALARSLPARLDDVAVVELGCGLGVPSLVAAARGGSVVAVDWACDAVALLRRNAERNGIVLSAETADWRSFSGSFDLALAADVLYERRNVEPLLELLPQLAGEAMIALAGRPYEHEFLRGAGERWRIDEVEPRVVRLTRSPSRDDGTVEAARDARPGTNRT